MLRLAGVNMDVAICYNCNDAIFYDEKSQFWISSFDSNYYSFDSNYYCLGTKYVFHEPLEENE